VPNGHVILGSNPRPFRSQRGKACFTPGGAPHSTLMPNSPGLVAGRANLRPRRLASRAGLPPQCFSRQCEQLVRKGRVRETRSSMPIEPPRANRSHEI
jgi:hypothetical protein